MNASVTSRRPLVTPRIFTVDDLDTDTIVGELLEGVGAVTLRGLFGTDEIAEAREIVMRESSGDAEAAKVTHFQGAAEREGKLSLQRRVWNLLAKGDVFSRMAAHPALMQTMRAFLGTEFIMGSIAANRILPGGPGQEPHIDYPYWDYHTPQTHPVRLNSSFPLNAQATIMLDPFTEETGATAYVPGSQRSLRYPDESDRFFDRCERMLGEPGDTVVFFGAVWHCAMPNHSRADRSAILIQYLPKWVKPMENIPAALPSSFVDAASSDMRQLLGLHYPYPEILDAARGGNAEGRTTMQTK
ncbi:ectoine hydroxylase-related dioxygenase (phytanoyl-CoA dioxygenase family) [Luteibacter rhizovicinus]|uniref:Ectoine hydroxylase-related dioxygenase (Phytanoyl-CoA dioxygenase family) n=1 Tax=Luteibacter rhizovicinus TaxID=242606 RepID=A0A4R3YNX0_9GAMM|nr:phytanoyl-CoA dioxygenase family protein [Luteibacter rhizovicinus]TCV93962.1 ectoine hydroxylase-related dioxygenase (phytanoyl-CoA dioxygenase family) [Luteibacter rhizovicinus]